MCVRTKIAIGIAAALVAILCLFLYQHRRIQQLSAERDRYRNNSEMLLGDVEIYRTKDSLNAARVQSLELSIQEFERFLAEDAKLIRELKAKNHDLASVNKTQSQTIIDLRALPRDTTIIRDTVQMPAIAVHCGDAWYNFDGILTKDEFTGKLEHRDSLLLVETVRYKRFLGFLWRTNKVKDRQLDCVTKSPHNSIIGLEHVVIEK